MRCSRVAGSDRSKILMCQIFLADLAHFPA
jgi:hypothetical protein